MNKRSRKRKERQYSILSTVPFVRSNILLHDHFNETNHSTTNPGLDRFIQSNTDASRNSNSIFLPASTSKYPIQERTVQQELYIKLQIFFTQWINTFVYLARKLANKFQFFPFFLPLMLHFSSHSSDCSFFFSFSIHYLLHSIIYYAFEIIVFLSRHWQIVGQAVWLNDVVAAACPERRRTVRRPTHTHTSHNARQMNFVAIDVDRAETSPLILIFLARHSASF